MENEGNQNIQNELAEEGNPDKINIDNERISKYKDIFDRHKNEEGFIDQEGNYNEELLQNFIDSFSEGWFNNKKGFLQEYRKQYGNFTFNKDNLYYKTFSNSN